MPTINLREVYDRDGWPGVLAVFRSTVRAVREAASARGRLAPLSRKRNIVQARLVMTSASGEDTPLASLKDDLERKQALRSVMPGNESEDGETATNWQRDDGSCTGGDPALENQTSKEDVNYRFSDDDDKQCGNCKAFQEPSGCVKVGGIIRRVDVCDLFQAARSLEALRVFRNQMRKYPR